MTLSDFYNSCSVNPTYVVSYFVGLPVFAAMCWFFGKREGHLSPWRYIYSGLVYLSCIPGLAAVSLCIYLFLFERGSIMNANIYTQVLPIISMFVTLWLIKANVSFDDVPGFEKIGSLMFILSLLIGLAWLLEKTNIYIFTYMPFYQFILLMVVAIIVLRLGIKRLFS